MFGNSVESVWYETSLTTSVLFADAKFTLALPGLILIPFVIVINVSIDDSGILIADESCAGSDGSITGILVSGGSSPYTFDWNGGPSSSIDTVGASAGSYSLVVSDAAGCTASSGPYTIGTGSGLVIDTTSMVVQDESCAGNDGSITGIVVSGGTSPYLYSWNGGLASGADTLGANAGSYSLLVTDQLGCTNSVGPITIGSSAGMSVDVSGITITDANCIAADGSITGITVSGGTSPYSFTWNGSLSSSADTSGYRQAAIHCK